MSRNYFSATENLDAIAEAMPSVDLSCEFADLSKAICSDDDQRSLADAVYMLGDKIADGLTDLAKAIREIKS